MKQGSSENLVKLRRQRQEGQEFTASLGYPLRPSPLSQTRSSKGMVQTPRVWLRCGLGKTLGSIPSTELEKTTETWAAATACCQWEHSQPDLAVPAARGAIVPKCPHLTLPT